MGLLKLMFGEECFQNEGARYAGSSGVRLTGDNQILDVLLRSSRSRRLIVNGKSKAGQLDLGRRIPLARVTGCGSMASFGAQEEQRDSLFV
jgi:hypothetical protein